MTSSRTNAASSSVNCWCSGFGRSACSGTVSAGGKRMDCPTSSLSPGAALLPSTRNWPVRAQRETRLKLTSGMLRLNQRSSRMPSSSSETLKVRGSDIGERLAIPPPIVDRPALEFLHQLFRCRTLPAALVAVLVGAAGDPPALPRQTVGLAHDQHGQLRLAARLRILVDRAEDAAQRPHLGPGEVVAELAEQLGIG